MLASTVVDHLLARSEDDVPVIWIYCNYEEKKSQTTENLLGSLIAQLVQWRKMQVEELDEIFKQKSHKERTRLSRTEYSELLSTMARRFRKIFVVIDALDECDEDRGTRQEFLSEVQSLQPLFHIMVTSRPLRSINEEFENALRIEIYARDADVEEYVQSRLEKDAKLSKMTKSDPGFRQFLEGAVVDRCKGMSVKTIRILLLNAMDMLILLRFLLAKLHMDTLAKKAKYNKKAVQLAASQLLSELDSTYDQALERINSQDEAESSLAKQVLSWISLTYEPLTMLLLQQALAFQRGDSTAEETALIESDLLISVCAGLVMMDTESEVVQLAHYAIHGYLHQNPHHFMPNTYTTISSTCLHHLLGVEVPIHFHELPVARYQLSRTGSLYTPSVIQFAIYR